MTRKEITALLTDILIADRLTDRKYYAREVTLDYGTNHPKRIDVMQFSPKGVIHVSDIEKGIFTCYEIKSCRNDVYSGNGLNFFGEKNYIVMTMDTYKQLQTDISNGILAKYLKEHYPESSGYFGIMVPVPKYLDLRSTDALYKEYQHPTLFEGPVTKWKIWVPVLCREGPRTRSTTELLFCILRSKHSYTNA